MKTIGVFDSGVGGLSVLRALLAEIAGARFVYLADSSHAPYGERHSWQVVERTQRIANALRQRHAIDALVVACNTATALAIDSLRQHHPDLPIVGVEPALKPAAARSHSGRIGVLATRGTLQSARFVQLRRRTESDSARPLHFLCQPCDGLADAIERGDLTATQALCERYIDALQTAAPESGPIDTLVLGCTHYPFASEQLGALCGPAVSLIETGTPVARRTRALLGLAAGASSKPAALKLLSTGDPVALTRAAQRWLANAGQASPLQV